MRIISGSLKGKSISFLKNLNTRPLKDIVKENIFNIIKHSNLINVKIEKSYILDLYSGIGSFGIECISRGADKVTFVEKDILAVNVLKTNLAKLSITERSEIINKSIEDAFKNILNKKYNIFFLDPPFADSTFAKNLQFIKENKLYNRNHLIIIHREKKTIDEIEDFMEIIIVKKYGRSKIIFGSFI